MRTTRFAVLAAATLVSLALPREGRAWGPEAHRATATIAERILQQSDPAVLKKLNALLATDKSRFTRTDIASEATWADVLRDKSEEARLATTGWHAVRLNPDNPDFGAACSGHKPLPEGYPASRGPRDNCSVDKITQFRTELLAPDTTPGERLAAVQFLLNLVSDLHDPLLAIDRGDQGGACTAVQIGTKTPVRLTALWETMLVQQAVGGNPAKLVPGPDGQAWTQGTPEGWARETFDAAKTVTYGFGAGTGPEKYEFPASSGPKTQAAVTCTTASLYKVPADYETKAVATVQLQLARAGVRLAAILREGFK